MLVKLIKYSGIVFIFFFSAFSIFMALTERELHPSSELKKWTAYTSFFEDRFYDLRMKLTLDPEGFDDRLVLAAIDDYSLSNIAVWPLPRTVWTNFIHKMDGYGAKVIPFDVFFSEPALACEGQSPDGGFADAITQFQMTPTNKVILPYALRSSIDDFFPEIPEVMYNFVMDAKQSEGLNLVPTHIGKRVFPIQQLVDSGAGLAIIEASEDPDGIFRHYKLLANVDDLYFPSYSLMAYEAFTGDRPVFEMTNLGDPKVTVSTGTLSLNIRGETKIRWFGGVNQFPQVSIYDILQADPEDPVMREKFSGKIVYVGSTAYGAHDLRHTPIDPMLPGIYFHMNMTKMLLDGRFFKPLGESTLYSWLMLLGGTLLIILVMYFNNAILDLFAVVTITSGLFLFDSYVLLPKGYEIKLFFCLFSVIATYSWETFLNFYSANKDKAKIRGTFSSFVAPAIVDQMLANPELVKVGGERKNITVFFSDVRDFTTISEKLTPEELSNLLNQYMGVMTDLIFANYGTLDKYIGDAIVAYWGAPVDVPNHAYHGVKTAIKMVEALPALNEKFRAQGFPELEHGMGLNTGDCSVGNMGSDKIFSYTALGDNMNLGARAESLCKFYGVEINITEFTLAAIPPELLVEFRYRILDKVRVKGKAQAVSLFEVFHTTHPLYQAVDEVKEYMRAFDLYQQQQFVAAARVFEELHEKFPKDKCFKRMLETCQDYIKFPPPPDWDGVFTHTSKG